MDETTQAIAAGIVRHLLTGAAGVLVSAGYLQSSQTEQFIGAGMLVVGIAWSWWQKKGQAEALDLLRRAKSGNASTSTPASAAKPAAVPGAKP